LEEEEVYQIKSDKKKWQNNKKEILTQQKNNSETIKEEDSWEYSSLIKKEENGLVGLNSECINSQHKYF